MSYLKYYRTFHAGQVKNWLTRVEDVRTRAGKFADNIAEMADTQEFRALIQKLRILFRLVGFAEGVQVLNNYLPPAVDPLYNLGDDFAEAAPPPH